jgi:hypothetical protein
LESTSWVLQEVSRGGGAGAGRCWVELLCKLQREL